MDKQKRTMHHTNVNQNIICIGIWLPHVSSYHPVYPSSVPWQIDDVFVAHPALRQRPVGLHQKHSERKQFISLDPSHILGKVLFFLGTRGQDRLTSCFANLDQLKYLFVLGHGNRNPRPQIWIVFEALFFALFLANARPFGN